MATSYSIGKRYGNFIKDLVDSGRYPTASKVMRERAAACRRTRAASRQNSKRCKRPIRKVKTEVIASGKVAADRSGARSIGQA